jgi:KUP system potassium uptake protein
MLAGLLIRLNLMAQEPAASVKHGEGRTKHEAGVAVMGLSALGIVFGDIGTSPLYTLKAVLDMTGGQPAPYVILGTLSLIIWTLIIVTSVKYVGFAMRIDNDGEGGILALMSLLGIKKHQRPAIVAIGLFGAALIYGDGAITPAISVLSALEGLHIAAPALKPYVLPGAVAILVALFAVQPLGTARIGKAFGPVMAVWFIVIGILGLWGIFRHPAVLAALNPIYGVRFLIADGLTSFLVLGGVFLCVTGAEALYADMGHFGARPIRLAWSAVVLPCLVLNYAGQSAIVLEGAPTEDNIFYQLCPAPVLVPFIILATIATIIASQSIITGAYSMTRQAIQLGWLPRVRVTQTSVQGYGQIYVGSVNWLLMFATVGLAVLFGKSDNLAAAYGIAVSLTMLMTSALLFIAMREVWGWTLLASGTVAGLFLFVDAGFFLANMTKVADGGYVPLILAALVYGVMWIWHRGSGAVVQSVSARVIPVEEFLASLVARNIPRVPGTAVFLTRTLSDTPPIMAWHVEHNRALHDSLLALTVVTEPKPWIEETERLTLTEMAPKFWHATAHYGFMERPDIPVLLERALAQGCRIKFDDVVYYVGHATILRKETGSRLSRWEEAIFAAMERNAERNTDYYRLPRDKVVEIGREIAI